MARKRELAQKSFEITHCSYARRVLTLAYNQQSGWKKEQMVIQVKADIPKCEGHANCMLSAPDLFDLDDADRVIVLQPFIEEAHRPRAEEAVHSCPVNAVWLEAEAPSNG